MELLPPYSIGRAFVPDATAASMSAPAGPEASKDSQNFARFSGAETGTVFGTVSFLDLEP